MRELLGTDERGGLRVFGGLLVAAGTVALVLRRTSFGDPWSDFIVFLILAALAEAFFWTGLLGSRWGAATRTWQVVYLLVGIVLTPVALFQFVEWVGGDIGAPLNTTWIFLITAVVAAIALLAAGVRVAAILMALALVVAWAGLWEELLDDGLFGDIDNLRWVLLAAGVLLLPAAAAVSLSRAPEGSSGDVVTVAGVSAVLAGSIVFVLPSFFIVPEGTSVEATTLFWDIELLLASLALIGFAGSGALARGPGYVGALGLAAFAFSVGLDLDDSSPAGKVLGWPLVLLVLGAGLLIASALPALRRRTS
jgi:hypothetical protein